LTKCLVVDLDGTLIKSDLLIESASRYLIQHPLKFFNLLLWFLQGKAFLKSQLAKYVLLDIPSLPYNLSVIEWLQAQKSQGHRIILATASHHLLADQVARHLQLFDEVLATKHDINLKGAAKAKCLVERFGVGGFDYVGNDWPDLEVWINAHKDHVVSANRSLLSRLQKQVNIGEVWPSMSHSMLMSMLRAMRMHQWVKNLLIFVPLIAAHQYTVVRSDALAFMAFVVFGIIASSVYMLNDLVDLEDDRHHILKRSRPFASGELSLIVGWVWWPMLLLIGLTLSVLFLPVLFTATLILYYTLTLAYSLSLKKIAVVDVLTLAMLYTFRIVAGAFAIDVVLSFWLLLFSMFIFLSLALIKRFSELKYARDAGELGALRGRGYEADDLELVSSLGGSSGFIAVLVLALYINDRHTGQLYATPELIWLACPVMLYWIARLWLIAHRGGMHIDPILFTLRDKASWFVGVFMLSVIVLARVFE
jgi:4-hydroxybenzoate polyprenyltransferase